MGGGGMFVFVREAAGWESSITEMFLCLPNVCHFDTTTLWGQNVNIFVTCHMTSAAIALVEETNGINDVLAVCPYQRGGESFYDDDSQLPARPMQRKTGSQWRTRARVLACHTTCSRVLTS